MAFRFTTLTVHLGAASGEHRKAMKWAWAMASDDRRKQDSEARPLMKPVNNAEV